MNVRCVFYLIFVTRKLIIEVLFNDFIGEERRKLILNKIGFIVFCVIMKGILNMLEV